MPDTYTPLREALAAGPTPGPWRQGVNTPSRVFPGCPALKPVANALRDEDAALIVAACNVAFSLLAERDSLAAEVERLRRLLSEARHDAEIDCAAASQMADEVERMRADAGRNAEVSGPPKAGRA